MRNYRSIFLAAVLVLTFVGIMVRGFQLQQQGTSSGLEVVEIDEAGEVVERWCAAVLARDEGKEPDGFRFRPADDPGQTLLVERYELRQDSPRCR